MISNRIMPTAEEIQDSRLRNNIPADWAWAWCKNPLCNEWVWYPPGAESATVAFGLPSAITCSAACTLELIQKLP
jgi:hypothetical protein